MEIIFLRFDPDVRRRNFMRARKILRIHRARESGGGEILARISKPGGTTRSSNDSFLGATNNTSHRRNMVRAFDSRIDIEREDDYRFENRDVEKDVYVGRMLGYLDPTVRSISSGVYTRATWTFRRVNAKLERVGGKGSRGHGNRHELHSVYTNFRPVW